MPRSFHRKMVILGGLSFDSWYAQNFGAIGWTLQDPSGAVALAINKRVDLGRNIIPQTYASYIQGVGWSNPSGEIARCDGSQVAQSNFNALSVIEQEKTYRLTHFIDNYNAGSLQATSGNNGFMIRSSGGAFIEDLLMANITGGGINFAADDTFEGDVPLQLAFLQQLGILASSAFSTPGDNPIDATNNGMAVAQTGQGNIPFVYSGDGGTTRLSFDTIAEINSIINMENGGFVMVAQSDTWAAGVDVLARFAVDADNEIVIFRDGTDLKIEYRETATSSIVTIPSGSPSGMFTIGGKWNVPGFGLRGLYNGVQVDTDKSIAAAIIGNLDKDECALFAADSSGTSSWAGDGAYPALQTETPDDSFFADYHNRSGL